MAKTVDRYFKFLSSSEVKPSGGLWYPAADVYQTSDGWIVKVELAGVGAEDIEMVIGGSVLQISGIRKDRTFADEASYHQMEITYCRFEKTVTFPESIEGTGLEFNFENGLLIISLRKS